MTNPQAIPGWLKQKIAEFQTNVNTTKTLKGQAKDQAVALRENQLKRLKQTMGGYKSYIQLAAFQGKIASHKAQYKEFQAQIDRLQKNFEVHRYNIGTEEELYKHRTKDKYESDVNSRQFVVEAGNIAQKESKDAAKRILVQINKMDNDADLIVSELDRQIQKLDETYDKLNDTASTLKRAQEKLKYFARQIYTDRLLMCLIIVIAIAIITIIALAIAGKTPKSMKGTLS